MNKKETTILCVLDDLSYILYNTLNVMILEKGTQKEIAEDLKFELQKQIDNLDKILINSRKKKEINA